MPIDLQDASNDLPTQVAGLETNISTTTPGTKSDSHDKGVVIGLYGIPGSGKTFLLNQLKQEFQQEPFLFFEGSEMIAAVVPGGLEAFQKMKREEQSLWRQSAIDAIRKECVKSGKIAVVTGHFMFWPDENEAGQQVYTQSDLDTYTHILYLDVPIRVVEQRRLEDLERGRPIISAVHLRRWQEAEKTQLRDLCRLNNILFLLLSPHLASVQKVTVLLRDFQHHDEKYNLLQVENRLDEILATNDGQLETMLVLDADRTLVAEDTGALFWTTALNTRWTTKEKWPLKTLFSSALGYSYTAFRQATLLYEEAVDDVEFNAICQDVATAVTIHPEFVALLRLAAGQGHVGAVVVTCGLRRVWDKILEKEGLSGTVKVIGGGRIADSFVVTPAIKGALVSRLRMTHQLYTFAFGDSPGDLAMLSQADQAIVVIGEEMTRSKTMDAALEDAIDNGGLQAYQILLPGNAPPRLDTLKLPLVRLTEQELNKAIFRRRRLHVCHATNKNAAKLLMTPMRDAAVAGPILRRAHRRAGWYLATEFLADIIGVEEYPILHVQGYDTSGHRLLQEEKTLIIALMRGGEAMALGVNDAFPLAMFFHANCADNIKEGHLSKKRTVILVDSVMNSGKTILKFVQHIRSLHETIRIVVVAGVVQAQLVSEGEFVQVLSGYKKSLSIVALRLSDNRFTGRGTTDTGNRLFNTTHLP